MRTDSFAYQAKDEELFREVERIQKGQSADFTKVYELSKKYIYKIIYDILRDNHAVEDMMQETYLQIFQKISTLQDPGSFNVWAGRIATNYSLRYLQKYKNPRELLAAPTEDGGDTGEFIFDKAEDDHEYFIPETVLENKEQRRMIGEVLEGLPTAQRLCVQYYYYEEMSVKDISKAMGTSEGTIKSRLNYARNSIKEAVKKIEVQQGVKLYSLGGLPILYVLFRQEVSALAEIAISGMPESFKAGGAGAKQVAAELGRSGNAAATANNTASGMPTSPRNPAVRYVSNPIASAQKPSATVAGRAATMYPGASTPQAPVGMTPAGAPVPPTQVPAAGAAYYAASTASATTSVSGAKIAVLIASTLVIMAGGAVFMTKTWSYTEQNKDDVAAVVETETETAAESLEETFETVIAETESLETETETVETESVETEEPSEAEEAVTESATVQEQTTTQQQTVAQEQTTPVQEQTTTQEQTVTQEQQTVSTAYTASPAVVNPTAYARNEDGLVIAVDRQAAETEYNVLLQAAAQSSSPDAMKKAVKAAYNLYYMALCDNPYCQDNASYDTTQKQLGSTPNAPAIIKTYQGSARIKYYPLLYSDAYFTEPTKRINTFVTAMEERKSTGGPYTDAEIVIFNKCREYLSTFAGNRSDFETVMTYLLDYSDRAVAGNLEQDMNREVLKNENERYHNGVSSYYGAVNLLLGYSF